MKRYLTIFGLLLAVPALGQTPTPPVAKPVAALQACRTIADPVARVACYDRAVDALTSASAAGDVVIVERTEVRKARKGLFGFTLPRIGFLTGKPDNAEDVADEAELETTITASRSVGFSRSPCLHMRCVRRATSSSRRNSVGWALPVCVRQGPHTSNHIFQAADETAQFRGRQPHG